MIWLKNLRKVRYRTFQLRFHVPDVPWFDSEPWTVCLPLAISLCFIGLVESVLTCRAVDELVDERSSTAMKNQVCMSQGLGNAVSSFFMAMGGCAMIGQSMINVNTGARGRMSSIVAGISVLAFVLVAYRFIEVIPLAALTGILFVVVMKTFKWSSVRDIVLRRIPIVDSITIILVTVLSVVQNLAIGVGVGILWQALAKSWTDAKHFEVEHKRDAIVVTGRIYFANCDDLIEAVGVVKGFSEVAVFARLMADSDEGKALAKALNIRQVPTFLFYRNGEPVGRHVGSSRGDLIGQVLKQQNAAGLPVPPPAGKKSISHS